jgi:hypothetical protein
MNTMKSILAAALVAFPGVAIADPDPTHVPMATAIERVLENFADHPNRGLANAEVRLFRNLERHETRDLDRVERPERPERIEFVSTRDFGRAHRPERPDRAGKK